MKEQANRYSERDYFVHYRGCEVRKEQAKVTRGSLGKVKIFVLPLKFFPVANEGHSVVFRPYRFYIGTRWRLLSNS